MIENNITPIVIVMGALILVAVALVVYLFWRTRRIESDYELLVRDSHGQNFVQIVSDNIEQAEILLREVERLSEQYAQVLRRLAGAVQHIGVVRFDAFRDLGGLLSFAVALLDDRGNGLVLSSIYGRSESRTYAKPVVERGSNYELSPEEREAIRLAMQSKELGSLPVEARDREHEERMANLRLFHDREYLQRSNHAEGRAAAGGRETGPERQAGERRAARRAPREEEQAEATEEQGQPRPRQARGRRAGERAPAANPRQRAAQPEELEQPKSQRPVDLVKELELDEPYERRTARTERARPPRTEGKGRGERAPEPRRLNTPVERLRDREPRREPRGE